MTSITLVHSPLLGPVSWEPVANRLSALGHEVAVPDLRGLTTADQIEAAAAEPTAVLAGHSGAGPLLPAIASLMGAVEVVVFVDAALPHAGRSRLAALPPEFADCVRSMARDGVLPPWTEWFGDEVMRGLVPDEDARARLVGDTPRVQIALFEEPMPVVPHPPASTCSYLQTSAAYDSDAETAAGRGWTVRSVDGTHLSLYTDPNRVTPAILDLVGDLTGP